MGERHFVEFDIENCSIPEGTILEAMAHTHGEHDVLLDGKYDDDFSSGDQYYADMTGFPLYLASPIGELRIYDPNASRNFENISIVDAGSLPHDKNHPNLPFYHIRNCKNCFEEE